MTNILESDTMKTLKDCIKESGGLVHADGNIFFTNEIKLLTTFNAWCAQQPISMRHQHLVNTGYTNVVCQCEECLKSATMKDNQMKQAEDKTIVEDLESVGFVYDNTGGAVFTPANGNGSLDLSYLLAFAALREARAKLTASQVSETTNTAAAKLPNGDTCTNVYEAYDIGVKVGATTAPQEAISPAIAEYIDMIEGALSQLLTVKNYKDQFGKDTVYETIRLEAWKRAETVLASKHKCLQDV